jgi:hypothetical protein
MSGDAPGGPVETEAAPRPKNLTFMVGWLVLLGVYQIFLAWRFGTFFEGTSGDLRADFGGAALEPLYASIGIFALIIAWGGWRLRPWAYVAAWVFQGMVFALAAVVIGLWLAGKEAPVGWLLLDLAFGVYNVWWLTRPDVRRAFHAGPEPGPQAARG